MPSTSSRSRRLRSSCCSARAGIRRRSRKWVSTRWTTWPVGTTTREDCPITPGRYIPRSLRWRRVRAAADNRLVLAAVSGGEAGCCSRALTPYFGSSRSSARSMGQHVVVAERAPPEHEAFFGCFVHRHCQVHGRLTEPPLSHFPGLRRPIVRGPEGHRPRGYSAAGSGRRNPHHVRRSGLAQRASSLARDRAHHAHGIPDADVRLHREGGVHPGAPHVPFPSSERSTVCSWSPLSSRSATGFLRIWRRDTPAPTSTRRS